MLPLTWISWLRRECEDSCLGNSLHDPLHQIRVHRLSSCTGLARVCRRNNVSVCRSWDKGLSSSGKNKKKRKNKRLNQQSASHFKIIEQGQAWHEEAARVQKKKIKLASRSCTKKSSFKGSTKNRRRSILRPSSFIKAATTVTESPSSVGQARKPKGWALAHSYSRTHSQSLTHTHTLTHVHIH